MILRLHLIGNDLRTLRKRLELTQAKVAQLSGLSKLTILAIENGLTSPNISTVNKIANALASTPEYKSEVNESIEIVLFSFDK